MNRKMGLPQLLSVFWYFIKEMLFDSKDEYDINSKKFNARRFTIALLLLFLFIGEIYSIARIYSLAKEVVELNAAIYETEKLCKKTSLPLIQ